MLEQQQRLSAEERRERQRLYLRDAGALGTLLLLVIALSFVTWGLFHSFNTHRQMLERRWRTRGEAALAGGKPLVALNDLHSALAYAPDDRGLQIELATALAAAGRTQEAQVYFSTLLESEPGNGMINLQLARLAVERHNVQDAVDHYQAAIDGTWNGDAFTRRRDIRLELARYLLAQHREAEARELLLVASGNSPGDYPLQLTLGGLLEQAGNPTDAMEVYRKAAGHKPTRVEALEGEGSAALALGRYALARRYLQQAVNDPLFAKEPDGLRNETHGELQTAEAVLALYPSDNLPEAERARRIAHLARLVQERLVSCPTTTATANANTAPDVQADAPERAAPLAALAAHLAALNPLARGDQPKAEMPPAPADPLAAIALRWTKMPTGTALERQLARDPDFAQNTMTLVYETAKVTAGCGPLNGEDVLLAKIAAAPEQVEAQP